jgi:iron complex transport system ATP-binding protein
MTGLAAVGLSAGHGTKPILSGIDLRILGGEMVGLIGANGAGKSTLLRTMAGLLPPVAGRLALDGTPIDQLPERARARRIAYLAQGGEVGWELAADAVVALGRLPHRSRFAAPSDDDRRAVENAMALCGLDALRRRPVSTLSGGERARVLLARALAVEADFLLADEPVAALDPLHQLTTLELLRTMAERGTGIVVVLHDLGLASRFCHRLVLLAEGHVLADGAPGSVLTDEALARAYGIAVARPSIGGLPYPVPWRPASSTPGGGELSGL